ncbi:C6 zinc finger domain protein [Thozetella sp. PMI_491]|nr:C6 zinc finger domain protein [Thozetella sp. PMI_491]
MVGVPRSTGCQLCVKRRVKCDQQKPACGNCIKYGADCPGYERGFKFVAGKHAVRSRNKAGSPEDGQSSSSSSTATPSSSSSGANSRTGSLPNSQSLTLLTPADNRGLFLGNILQSLREGAHADEVRIFNTWINTMVPPHLGNKITLDSAMAAFVLQMLGKANDDQRLLAESRHVYGQSLVALQRALDHPTEWSNSETLASAMILAMFEMFAGTSHPDTWMKHASGVAWLILQRGPAAHQNPFDRQMLLSMRPMMVMDCLFNLKDCFLARPSWQRVLLGNEGHHMPIVPELTQLVDLYFVSLAKVPSILKYAWVMRDAMRHGLPVDTSRVPALIQQAVKLRDDLLVWYQLFSSMAPGPVDIPSKDPGTIFEHVLEYQSPWHGSLYMGYWATLSIVQGCLTICGFPVDYAENNKELARNILRSVETVSAGVMGPYRVGYPVRIAYEFAELREQLWLLGVLAKFQKTYAATSPEVYERPGQDAFDGALNS